jgi:hypothetical protein
MSRLVLVNLFVCAAFAWSGTNLYGQNGNKERQDEKKENERVDKAERAVNETRKELVVVQKELRSQSTQLEKIVHSLGELRKRTREAREDAEDRLGAKIGIPAALSKVRVAGATLEQSAAKVRKEVHATNEWLLAKAAADQAKETRAAILEDANHIEDENNGPHDALLKLILKPLEIENAAIAKDPNSLEGEKHLAQQQSELNKLRKLLPSGQVDRDREVVQALQAVEKKEKELNEMESQFRKSKGEASKLQKRFVEAQLSLQRAKAADAADPNRPVKTKGK